MHVPRKFTLFVIVIYVWFSFQASKCNSFSFHMKLVHIKIIVEENHIPCSHRERVFVEVALQFNRILWFKVFWAKKKCQICFSNYFPFRWLSQNKIWFVMTQKKKENRKMNSFWNICLKRFSSAENNERRLVEKTALVGAPFRSCEEMIRKSCEIWDCKISVKETKEQRFAVEIISPPSAILWVDILHTFRSECASVHEKNPKPFSMIRG